MKRGEIWTAAGGADYARKPRPVLILQNDRYSSTDSVIVCPMTSEQVATEFLRPMLKPNSTNGLLFVSRIMIDKVIALPRSKLRERVGQIDDVELRDAETALMTILGMAQ